MFFLEALTQRNQGYLKARPHTPRLYKSGVRYEIPKQFGGDCEEVAILRKALGKAAWKRDVRKALEKIQGVLGGEHFCDIGVILELGSIDCDGLACYRAAELRQAGIQARPYMTHRERFGGGTTYHALVLWPPFGNVPYVTSEDPSLLLGMGGPERAPERAEENRKNQERCDIIRRYGILPQVLVDPAAALGLRRESPMFGEAPAVDAGPALAEIERLLRVAA